MMDSARALTFGSSSTTRTVVVLAFSDFIRPTPLALKTATMGQKRSSDARSYFTISISPVALMQRKLGSPEAATDYKLWPFAPIRGVSRNMHRASNITGNQVDRARRLARV